jgi:hypothetical protein
MREDSRSKTKRKKPESIVPCIMAGEGQCCIGKECPLYKQCFSDKRATIYHGGK